ncbi:phosphoribosylaminoimidazolesuccinocarboxamide synthase [Sphingobacterium chuzhouense]|uniref:Phosphoribosylaminoimidazole-succinocarboxamide synthase n=1 Tax=Sphingobacterium chuzhouense TaxID=1742264 RepID=A0ABR7XMJ6_9SPHI|nr:phosphoribosylaminoimidazolesuccinocarboxamide synthase [Sphingobacterium chuzhouense]MBD1420395.1 phosphoribosylaminoimidazolesuccinocarboxamide synthase [Sphingobacterium chuzhouense]
MNAIKETTFNFDKQTAFYKGKVRDVYTIADEYLVMVASDRISAFDVVLPRPIPYKGQVLNQIAEKFLSSTKDIIPNWVITVPDPNATIGYKCEPFKVEMVIRGYLAGHLWRTYRDGKRILCGVTLPEGLKENDKLPEPIITPTTKADVGHDEDISREDIMAKGIVREEDYVQLENFAHALYQRGAEMAQERGLILVDTKYEFGKKDGEIYLMDEIHTPDSSRYFYAEGYEERQANGEPQRQLSKEFVREWLMDNGFQGKDGQIVPEMTDDIVRSISERYIELYEHITGERFQYSANEDTVLRVEQNVTKALNKLL